jgi:hypothetical protein
MPRARLARDRRPVRDNRVARNIGAAGAVSLAVALVVTGRSLGRGIYLYRDFVTVPDPVQGTTTWGGGGSGAAPRAVPLDGVMAALSPLVPSGVQQQGILVGSLFLAGLGVAVLLRHRGLAAMVAAAVVAMWNPYVTERLLVGQPPTLLAYSMTPWLVAVVRSRLPTGRGLAAVLVAALPAALTPFGGVVAALVVLAASVGASWRWTRTWLAGCVALGAVWCLPWLVPALAHNTGGADPDGARAFALAADSPLGVLGSALTLGGIWATGGQPGSRGSAAAVTGALLLALVALIGLVPLVRRGRDGLSLALGAAWLAPPVLAWAVSGGPGLRLFTVAQAVPGVAIFRDTHRWLGLSALALAVLCGMAVCELARAGRSAVTTARMLLPSRVVPVAAAVVTGSLAVLSVPDLAQQVHAAYRPVSFPADWAPMVRAADEAADGGRVLVLPWQPLRQVPWAGPQPFLDPLARAVRQPVLGAHELRVVREGQVLTVDDDPVRWRSLVEGEANAQQLRAAGVGLVVVWKDTPGKAPAGLAGAHLEFDGPHFSLWALTRR